MSLKLRPARPDDCELAWKWANDATVRSASFSELSIPWDNHVLWFNERIKKPHYYIAMDLDNNPVGQARLDDIKSKIIISVLIGSQYRNRGYGSALIRIASEILFSSTPIREIHAYIKEGNEPSIMAFTRAGFQKLERIDYMNTKALHFLLSK